MAFHNLAAFVNDRRS